MTVRMTDTAIQAAVKRVTESGKRFDLSDAALPGLRLRLTPSGGRSWVLACRDTLGGMRRFPLGEHPTMGISEAREAARTLRADVRRGADPVAEARRKRIIGREARDGIGTLTAVLNLYAKQKGDSLKSWPECRRRIDHVFAAYLPKAVAMLKAADLQMTADAHTSQQSAAAAVRYIRPVLKWAAQRRYLAAETAVLHPPATVRRRNRVLTRDELAALLPVLRAGADAHAAARRFIDLIGHADVSGLHWRQIDLTAGTLTHRTKPEGKVAIHVRKLPAAAVDLLRGLPAGAPGDVVFSGAKAHAAALWFMLLTMTRRQETALARWRDVDLGARTWTITETKNGQDHVVPLSRQAMDMLRSRMPPDDDGKPDPDAPIFTASTGAALGNWDRATKTLQEASGTTGWTRHDLRRTGATLLGDMGELPDIIEAALNHTTIHSSLAATYNRSRYRPQVAAALQRLADALDGIEAGVAKVVPLRAGA